jgi:type I restriction enzyme M protein
MTQQEKRVEELKNLLWEWVKQYNFANEYIPNILALLLLTLKTEGFLEKVDFTGVEDYTNLFKNHLTNTSSLKSDILLNIIELLDKEEKTVDSCSLYVDDTFLSLNSKELRKYKSILFEDLLNKIVNKDERFMGEFVLPKELSHLMTAIYKVDIDDSIYNPFAGFGSFALSFPNNSSIHGEEISIFTYCLNQMRMIANDKIENVHYKLGDSFATLFSEEFKADFICSAPPFDSLLSISTNGEEKVISEADSYIIDNSVKSLTSKGRMTILALQPFLYKDGAYKELRKTLIKEDLIEHIVFFPSNILYNTAIPFYLITFNKKKTHPKKIYILDASDFILRQKNKHGVINSDALIIALQNFEINSKSRLLSNNVIVKSDYNMVPARYLTQEIEGELIEKFLIQVKKKANKAEVAEGRIVSIKDLKSDSLNYELDYHKLSFDACGKNYSLLNESSLLISTIGSKLSPTFLKLFKGQKVYIHNGIVAFKVNEDKIDLSYLINELNSDNVIQQVSAMSYGLNQRTIRIEDLLKIKIKIIPLEEQKALVKGLNALNDLQKRKELLLLSTIEDLENSIFDENSFLRHSIAGPLKNIRSAFKNLSLIIETQIAEIIPSVNELKSNTKSQLNFGKYLDIIERDLLIINDKVKNNSFRAEAFVNSKFESVELISFIQTYIDEVRNRENIYFKIEFNYDKFEWSNSENGSAQVFINGDKQLLRDLFNNLVENAENHAFFNGNANKIAFSLMSGGSDNTVYLYVENSGKPFPPGFTQEMFIRKGSKSGIAAGDGFGGWYINEITKAMGGYLVIDQLQDVPGMEDSPTGFQFVFPIILQ